MLMYDAFNPLNPNMKLTISMYTENVEFIQDSVDDFSNWNYDNPFKRVSKHIHKEDIKPNGYSVNLTLSLKDWRAVYHLLVDFVNSDLINTELTRKALDAQIQIDKWAKKHVIGGEDAPDIFVDTMAY